MKYLLDTNVFIFLITKDFGRLSFKQKQIIFDSTSELYLSEASFYELGIKVRLEKPDFAHINIQTIDTDRKKNGIKLLKAKPVYFTNIPNVPKVIGSGNKIHGDPFDLLIISQALVEDLPILSTDSFFPLYVGLTVVP